MPLIEEYQEKPGQLMIGEGRYGIVLTDAAKNGYILDVKHPHNMYIEAILESGVIGLVAFILIFAFLLKALYTNLHIIEDSKIREFYYGFLISIISYLIAGLTGRSFFPDLQNSFLWLTLGGAFVFLNLLNTSKEMLNEKI